VKSVSGRTLATGLIDTRVARLRDEWDPQTPTQELYVREIARHQAALARAEAIEEGVLREGARTLLALGASLGGDELLEDSLLSAAGTSDGLEKISRYRRQHERALGRSLAELRELKLITMPAVAEITPAAARAFRTEQECEAYLFARMRQGGFRCSGCGNGSARWLAARRVWQCDECRRQSGLRTGTVMERSRVSLLAWFGTIECVIVHSRRLRNRDCHHGPAQSSGHGPKYGSANPRGPRFAE
jgi:Transposase zinc-ribbon domain